MNVDADFSQVDRLAGELAAAGPIVEIAARRALSDTANRLGADAKAAVPVRTGTLMSSIVVRGEGDERVVEATAPYAMFVEFGTSVMGPQPFMWPAASRAEKTLMTEVEKLGDPFV